MSSGNPKPGSEVKAHVPANKLSTVLKVVQKGPEDDATIKGRTIATLKLADVQNSALGDIRRTLNLNGPDSTPFCYSDYSPARDTLILSDYLAQENESIDLQAAVENGAKTSIVPCILFIAPAPEAAPAPASRPLTSVSTLSSGGAFAVMAYELGEGGERTSRGALQSESLGTSTPSNLTLAGLRKLLASATKMSTKHKFCTASGMPAIDENMTFAAYLRLEAEEADSKAELPSIKVYYKLTQPRTEQKPFKELDQMGGKVDKSDHSLTDTLKELDDGKKADGFNPNKQRASEIDLKPTMKGFSSNPYAVDSGYLTEGEWAEVMRNCGVMHGWIVNTQSNQIIRAPKAAFRLRMKPTPESKIPDIIQEDESKNHQPNRPQPAPLSLLESTKLRVQELRKNVGNWADANHLPSRGAWGSSDLSAENRLRPIAAADNGSQEPNVSTLGVRHGKEQDKAQSVSGQPFHAVAAIVPAQSIAQNTSNNSKGPEKKATGSEPSPTKDKELPQKSRAFATAPITAPVPATGPAATATTTTTTAIAPLPILRAVKEVPSVLPSFQVNDNSRVEVIVSSHEFETSMARNDFSSTSTEASMSGGFGGFAASVSVGRESQKSSGSKTTENSYEKTMIAKYMIPRADIYLHPDDLEPTPELQEAIERIRTQKNVADLRKLQKDFGQLWCQRVTLGGRLQSSKTMSDTSKTTEHQQKEAFKWSVGSQVTTPYASASVKHTEAGGSSTEDSTTDVIKKEKNVFEAVGGDTILVINPELWAASVADFRTWRVIDRGSLSSLVDALSSINGYEPVRSWFMQAIPTLSKYIELPPSREVTVRLKVNSPTTQLSLSYLKQLDTQRMDAGGKQQMDPTYYFGRTDDCLVNPVENAVNLQTDFWSQLDMEGAKRLFFPQEYRAPVLRGFQGGQALSDADFTNTLWTMSAPFNEALQHQALVVIQTVPARKTTTLPTPGTANIAPDTVIMKPLSLGVFRNQQGVFLPCLTDSSAPGQQFWRILKTDLPSDNVSSNSKSDSDQPFIRQGDEISLAWYLADQTTGFRDFENDTFGRRRFAADTAAETKLYLKLPWPRFEALQPSYTQAGFGVVKPPKSNAMVMSEALPSFTSASNVMDGNTSSAGRGIPKLTTMRTLPSIIRAREHESRTRVRVSDESVFAVQDVSFRVDVVGGINDNSGSAGQGDLDDELVPGNDVAGLKGNSDRGTEPIMVHFLGMLFYLSTAR